MARTKLSAVVFLAAAAAAIFGQGGKIVWSDREKPLMDEIAKLRSLPDDERVSVTKGLAIQIRQLPAGAHKVILADSLAHLVTEGDPGPDALLEVATSLAQALREQPAADSYATLAEFVRYEHVPVSCCPTNDPRFAAAMAKLEADDQARRNVDFTLLDLTGKSWMLKDLRGSVVLVNFWATWCPPCRKEMPDLDALYRRFSPKGLVILAISDEEAAKVQPFIAEHAFAFPVLLDPGRKVNDLLRVEGIPKSFVYDREGRLVAQAMDMRTQKQFLEMLAQANLE
jgi:peroxiredoxin